MKWLIFRADRVILIVICTRFDMDVIQLVFAVACFGPPHVNGDERAIDVLRTAGVELHGRHPAPNSGFNMALLPVRTESDVRSVTLPFDRLPKHELRLLKQLPHLRKLDVECDRRLTLDEYTIIREMVPAAVSLPRFIRGPDGRVGPTHKVTARFPSDSK